MSDYRERLIAARERLGLSREDMAERLLTPRQTYSQWEAGVRRTPGVAVIAAELIAPRSISRADRAQAWLEILAEAKSRDETPAMVCQRLGLSRSSLRREERRTGIVLRKEGAVGVFTHGKNIDWPTELTRSLEAGETLPQTARRLGVMRSSVRQAEQKTGIGPLKRGNKGRPAIS